MADLINGKKISELPEAADLLDSAEFPGSQEGATFKFSWALIKAKIILLIAAAVDGFTQGPQGVQGAQGPQGIQGLQGLQGLKGDKGDQGVKGDQGPKGNVGIQGATGEKGDKGDKGDQGVQGVKGDQGDPGDPGVVESNEVEFVEGDFVAGVLTLSNWQAGVMPGDTKTYVEAYGNRPHFSLVEYYGDNEKDRPEVAPFRILDKTDPSIPLLTSVEWEAVPFNGKIIIRR